MNAVELLKADHDVVRKLFQDVKESDESKHPPIFEKIKAELDVHAHIEETIFYPKMQADGDKELVDLVLEGIEEHRQMKMFPLVKDQFDSAVLNQLGDKMVAEKENFKKSQ